MRLAIIKIPKINYIKSHTQKILLYVNTIRYLKLRQISGRAFNCLLKPKPDLRKAPQRRSVSGNWKASASKRISMLSASKFNFLNVEFEIITPSDWNSRCLSKLWLYNLHYFDDLNAHGAPLRKGWHLNIIERWVNENPPGFGCGWEPYPISLRIVNWIKYALAGGVLNCKCTDSLAVQIRYLCKRLEWHLLGNHLFSNAKALIFGGCYFQGDEAQSWLKIGMSILEREIPEQILNDGGHFERSPMYHALALEDLLDLVNLANTYPDAFMCWRTAVAAWSETIKKMGVWLMIMTHPDGEISFFNDAAFGIAPSTSNLYLYCDRLGIHFVKDSTSVKYLTDSGYIRIEKNGAVLIIDVAKIGPDYLPGHAHADTLSYEFSLNGRRIIVNSGTSTYVLGPEREWERSTGAHNTIEIDGESSSEVWGCFRVARRAYPFNVSVYEEGSRVIVEACHDGYTRLQKHLVHRRRWTVDSNRLEVYDKIEGEGARATSRVYLHPDAEVEIAGSEGRILHLGECMEWESTFTDIVVEETLWHPQFGVSVPNRCIAMLIKNIVKSATGYFAINWL